MPQPVSGCAEPRVEVATGPEFGDYWGGQFAVLDDLWAGMPPQPEVDAALREWGLLDEGMSVSHR